MPDSHVNTLCAPETKGEKRSGGKKRLGTLQLNFAKLREKEKPFLRDSPIRRRGTKKGQSECKVQETERKKT